MALPTIVSTQWKSPSLFYETPITLPSSIQDGDIVILFVRAAADTILSDFSFSLTNQIEHGWRELMRFNDTVYSTRSQNRFVLSKTWRTGDPTTINFNMTPSSYYYGEGEMMCVVIRGAAGVALRSQARYTSSSTLTWAAHVPMSAEGISLFLGSTTSPDSQSSSYTWTAVVPSGTTILPVDSGSAGSSSTSRKGFSIAYQNHTTAANIASKTATVFTTASEAHSHVSAVLDVYTPITLNALTVSNTIIQDNVTPGVTFATVSGNAVGSSLSITSTSGNKLSISNSGLIVLKNGATLSIGDSITATITESLAGATNTPRSTTIYFTVIEGYRGPTWVSTGSAASGTGNVTVQMPSNILPDDLLMLFVETANQTVSTPSGWTLSPFSPIGNGTAGSNTATALTTFYKFAGSSESSVVVNDPGDHAYCQILAFRNVDKANPFDNYSSTTGVSSSSFSLSLNTSAHTLVVAVMSVATDTSTARFSGWTNSFEEKADGATTQGNGGGLGVATLARLDSGNIGTTASLATASLKAGSIFSLNGPPIILINPLVDLELSANYVIRASGNALSPKASLSGMTDGSTISISSSDPYIDLDGHDIVFSRATDNYSHLEEVEFSITETIGSFTNTTSFKITFFNDYWGPEWWYKEQIWIEPSWPTDSLWSYAYTGNMEILTLMSRTTVAPVVQPSAGWMTHPDFPTLTIGSGSTFLRLQTFYRWVTTTGWLTTEIESDGTGIVYAQCTSIYNVDTEKPFYSLNQDVTFNTSTVIQETPSVNDKLVLGFFASTGFPAISGVNPTSVKLYGDYWLLNNAEYNSEEPMNTGSLSIGSCGLSLPWDTMGSMTITPGNPGASNIFRSIIINKVGEADSSPPVVTTTGHSYWL